LEKRRIIRTVKYGSEIRYEISHDILAEVVGSNLTEEMKMRREAKHIYRAYEDDYFFTRKDLTRLDTYKQYLPFPTLLEHRVEESYTQLKQDKKRTSQVRNLKLGQKIMGVFVLVLTAFMIISLSKKNYDLHEKNRGQKKQIARDSHLTERIKIERELTFNSLNYSTKMIEEQKEKITKDSISSVKIKNDRQLAFKSLHYSTKTIEKLKKEKDSLVNIIKNVRKQKTEVEQKIVAMKQRLRIEKEAIIELPDRSKEILEELEKQRDCLKIIFESERMQKTLIEQKIYSIEEK